MKIKSLLATALLSLNAFAGDIVVVDEKFNDFISGAKWDTEATLDLGYWNGVVMNATDAYGVAVLNDTHDFSKHYDVSAVFLNEQVVQNSHGLVFKFKDTSSAFYSAHIVHGANGGVVISKHTNTSDTAGTPVYTSGAVSLDAMVSHTLKLTVAGDEVTVTLNGFELDTVKVDSLHSDNRAGLLFDVAGMNNAYVDSFSLLNYSYFEDTFENGINSNWTQYRGDWTHTDRGITSTNWNWLLSTDDISIEGDFGFEMDWENAKDAATTSPYIMLNKTEDGSFYSVSVKPGPYGRVSFKSHANLGDGAGTLIKSNPLSLPYQAIFNLKTEVKGDVLTVKLDGETVLTETITINPTGNQVGLQNSSVTGNWSIHRINITK